MTQNGVGETFSKEKIKADRAAGKPIDYFLERGAAKHSSQPSEELYDTQSDPDELVNIAAREEVSEVKARLRKQLFQGLEEQGDYLGENGPVLFLQGKQHELDEPSEKFNYALPDELVGILKGRKSAPHAITGPNREIPDPGAPVVREK